MVVSARMRISIKQTTSCSLIYDYNHCDGVTHDDDQDKEDGELPSCIGHPIGIIIIINKSTIQHKENNDDEQHNCLLFDHITFSVIKLPISYLLADIVNIISTGRSSSY